MKADGLVAELAHQKDALARRLVHGFGELVLLPSRFEAQAHLVFRPEEAVSRDGVVQALVGSEVVVVVDEGGQALLGFMQLLGPDSGPELFTNGLPKALALAHGLRVLGSGQNVVDALAVQQLPEAAGASPGVILPSLVREQLLGFAKALDAFQKCFLNEVRGLSQAQTPRDDIAAVVVHEGDQIHLLAVPSQVEAGDVGLPKLARL